MDLKEVGDKYNSVEEWLGFNYKEYTKQIQKFIKGDEFAQIKAMNAIEEAAGKLSRTQVLEFKKILGAGFKNGSSISEMVKQVNKKLGLKDIIMREIFYYL